MQFIAWHWGKAAYDACAGVQHLSVAPISQGHCSSETRKKQKVQAFGMRDVLKQATSLNSSVILVHVGWICFQIHGVLVACSHNALAFQVHEQVKTLCQLLHIVSRQGNDQCSLLVHRDAMACGLCCTWFLLIHVTTFLHVLILFDMF